MNVENVIFIQVLQIRQVGFAELSLALSPDVVSLAGEVEVLKAVAVSAAGGPELRGESLSAGELTRGAAAEETMVEARGARIVHTPSKQKYFLDVKNIYAPTFQGSRG